MHILMKGTSQQVLFFSSIIWHWTCSFDDMYILWEYSLFILFSVVRTKKRTIPAASSLRSNKKVSSLVDKVCSLSSSLPHYYSYLNIFGFLNLICKFETVEGSKRGDARRWGGTWKYIWVAREEATKGNRGILEFIYTIHFVLALLFSYVPFTAGMV